MAKVGGRAYSGREAGGINRAARRGELVSRAGQAAERGIRKREIGTDHKETKMRKINGRDRDIDSRQRQWDLAIIVDIV